MNRQHFIMFLKICIFSLLVVYAVSYAMKEKEVLVDVEVDATLNNKKDNRTINGTTDKKDEDDKMEKMVKDLEKSNNAQTGGCNGPYSSLGAIREFVKIEGCVGYDEGICQLYLGDTATINFAFTATEDIVNSKALSYKFCGEMSFVFATTCIGDPFHKDLNFYDEQLPYPLQKGKTYVVSVQKKLPNLPMQMNLAAQVRLTDGESSSYKTFGCVRMPLQLIKKR